MWRNEFRWYGAIARRRRGVKLALSSGRRPISLTLGTSYVHNQQVDYLRPGDIEFTPQGDYVISPVRGDVDFLTFELGLRFAF